ncbi:MAG TPA: hypothetical protein VJP39_02670 [Gaiellaceae bacterium]|nr:hypothetical protein [Gaiellaceae bacterium]
MSSPSRNRVTPLGDVVAVPLRGAWTGNRGRLHDGREIVRFHAGDLWIVCALEFNNRWHEQWKPRGFTWLYFHDEAVAFAAGHRPCGECRRASYNAYRDAWGGNPSATDMNKQLHAERIFRGTHRRQLHAVAWRELPDGAFVLVDESPFLVHGDELVEWTTAGYGASRARPRGGTAQAITPPSTLAVLRNGYPVQVDQRRKAR